jgi:hypothetical protein
MMVQLVSGGGAPKKKGCCEYSAADHVGTGGKETFVGEASYMSSFNLKFNSFY